jgi:hypothetical protein
MRNGKLIYPFTYKVYSFPKMDQKWIQLDQDLFLAFKADLFT